MSDLSLAIKLSTEGGQVVVKELTQIGQAAGGANTQLTGSGTAGKVAAQGFDEVTKEAGSLTSQLNSLKGTVGLLAAGLGTFLGASYFKDVVAEQEQLQRNMLRTDAVIKATSEAAGFSAKQLHEQARALALSTLQSTEGVMRAQQVLLSYSSISDEVFSRAIETATDLATLIGGSLNGSLEMLAKTLDNPIEGINAMRRQGIYFTDAQQRVIASLIETNRLAEAQSMILDELAGQFGGIAQREALGLAGAQDTLGQAMQELKIQISEQLGLADNLAAVYNSTAEGVFSITAALSSGELADLTPTLQAAVSTAELLAHVLLGLGVIALGKYAVAQLAVIQGKLLLNTQAVTTVSALGLVTTTAGTSTVALNALSMAARVALGPLGLIAAALGVVATAFVSYKNSAEDAKKETDEFTARVNRMSSAAKANEYKNTQLELIELARQRIKAEDDLAKAQQQKSNSGFGNVGAITRAAKLIADLSKEEEILSRRLKVLNDDFEQGLPGLNTYKKLTEDSTEKTEEFNKALLGLYNNQRLAAAAVDEHGRALTGIDFEIFKANFKELAELPADAEAAIRRYYETTQTAAKNAGADTALKSLREETALLKVRLAQGEAEYEIQKALFQLKGSDPAVLQAIEQEIRLQQELNKQIAISEDIAADAWGRMLDDMTALSSAGQSFGDALTQAFGRVAQQIDGMTAAQVNYNRQLEDLAKKRHEVEKLEANSPKRAAALLDIQRTEARLGREHFQAQIGQYAALTGAAAQMFGEQSKEREKLHKLEQAFSVVEMALAMERAAANALAAIANQGTGDPYTAFARIAAMAALMAGLGLFSGSASGNANMSADRQASQGTGTVLGHSDAKSASISNALDRIAELSLDQYVELRAINSNIKALSSGIANLAVNLVSNFGKFNEQSYQGELGTNKQFQLNGSLASVVALGPLGGAVDQLLGGFVGNIFNSVLGGISKTTKNLIDSGIAFDTQNLGEIIATGLVDAAYYNVIETTKRKLWGLSKKTSTSTEYSALDDALLAEFGRIFTHLGTSINAAVDMLGIDVAKTLDNFVINLPNISFKDLSGDEIAAELEAVFSQQADLMTKYLLPQIGEYQKMGEGLYDTLIRVAQEQAVFNAQLDALGLQLGDLSAVLRIDVAQSIIELMGGVEAFRDATAEYFSAFYSESEQFDYLSKTVTQAFKDLNLPLPQTREQFRAIVDALDLTTDAGQQLFAQLMQLVPGLDQYFTGLDAQKKEFEDATAELASALAQQLGAINDVLSNIGNDILSLQRTLPGFDNIAYITSQIAELTTALSGSTELDAQLDLTNKLRDATMQRYNAELQALQEASSAAQAAHRAELQAIQALNKAAESLSKTAASMLLGDLSPLTTGQRLTEAQSQFDAALLAARGGDADAYGLVQQLGQQILQLQKEFNPAAYTDVFGDIKAIFDELGGNVFAEPDAALHPDIIAYEEAKITLAEQTIAELQRLQEQTALLREVAQQNYQTQLAQIPVVNGAVVVNNDNVVAQIKALQASQVAAAQAAAQQQAAAEAKQQQQLAAQEQQQIKIWRAINEQNELMQQIMRR